MNISQNGIDFIKISEGFRNEAYLDSALIPTIGYGTIRYANGDKVMISHTCTKEEAEVWLRDGIQLTINAVNNLSFSQELTQNMFDALCSFAYNLGISALRNSTLYRKARQNIYDETIYKYDVDNPERSCEFTKWCMCKGKVVKGLLLRRMKEADLYGQP